MGLGLWQQIPGLPEDQADCHYRVELMRTRLIALMDRSPGWVPAWGPTRADAGSEADDDFAHLLRETQAACGDASPELAHKLERLSIEHARERERRQQSAAARRELSALEGF